MANPADKSDKEVREATETLQNVADEIDREGGVKRTIEGQEQAEEMVGEDAEPDDEEDKPSEDASGELPMGGFGRMSSGQQN